MSNYKLRIRPTVLVVMLFLVGISSLSTLLIQYVNSQELAQSAVSKYVKHITKNTEIHLNNFNKFNFDLISMLEQSQDIQKNPQKNMNLKLLKKFATGIENNPFIYAIYVGFDNRDFYELINLDIDDSLRVDFNSKKDEKWLVVKIINKEDKKLRLNQFLDKDFNLLRDEVREVDYDPTKRPWYKMANNSKKTIVTSPYKFSNLDAYGLTYAKKIKNSKVVLGVDVSLKSLSSLLASEKELKKTQIYLYDKNKKVIASNLLHKKQNIDEQTFDKMKNGQILKIENYDFFVSTATLDSTYFDNNYLLILISKDEAMSPYTEKILQSIAVNIFLLFLTLPLIWYSTKLIINPIHALEEENEKIKNLNFDNVKHIQTPIKELDDLSISFVSMAKAIRKHEKSLHELMDSFIKLIASAIDAKSEYTGGHCNRVPKLTLLIAKKANESKKGIFKDFTLESKDEIRELEVASWLHDCGKVTTPEYVVDKAVKLETIYNRIHEIRMRFEVIHRDLVINSYEKILRGENKEEVNEWLAFEQKKLQDEFTFIANTNLGSEFMDNEDIKKVHEIGKREWERYFDDSLGLSFDEQKRYEKPKESKEYLLRDKKSHIVARKESYKEEQNRYNFKDEVPKNLYNYGEIYNLCITRGTLNQEERYKINEHINMTIKMLEQLPFPNNLKRVPEYAGAHHETLIGTGYPRKLSLEQISIPARIMALSDVFEALTATDRPYKKAKTLSETIKMLSFMVKNKHLDKEIFELFLESKAYLEYANNFLTKEQIDEVDINFYISKS